MRAFYLDIDNGDGKIVDIEDKLKTFYEMLNCRVVEMPERRIGIDSKHYFTFICDEEGLLKDNPMPSAMSYSGKMMLFGNLLIVNTNEEGDLVDLTVDECEYITQFIQPMEVQNTITGEARSYLMLTECEY